MADEATVTSDSVVTGETTQAADSAEGGPPAGETPPGDAPTPASAAADKAIDPTGDPAGDAATPSPELAAADAPPALPPTGVVTPPSSPGEPGPAALPATGSVVPPALPVPPAAQTNAGGAAFAALPDLPTAAGLGGTPAAPPLGRSSDGFGFGAESRAAVSGAGGPRTAQGPLGAVESPAAHTEPAAPTPAPLVAQPPTFALSALTLAENAQGVAVGAIVVGRPSGRSFTYQVDDDRFEIVDGMLRLKAATAVDFESEATIELVLEATDARSLAVYQTPLTLTVTDVNDAPTAITLTSATITEDAPAGTVVGAAQVSDQDAGESHSFALVDDAGGLFAIDAVTGAVSLALWADTIEAASHDITIRATDSGGLSHDETLTVTVDPVATTTIAMLRAGLLKSTDYNSGSDGSSSYEPYNVERSLESFGFTVEVTGATDEAPLREALASQRTFALPELELAAPPTAGFGDALHDFVDAGGNLLVFGDYSGNIGGWLNSVFGFSLAQTFLSGDSTLDTVAAAGTAYEDGSATLPSHSATSGLTTATLPVGATSLYSNGGATAVAILPYGDGQITFLGWDWYNAQPAGSADGGWLDVLDASASRISGGNPTLEIDGDAAELAVLDSVALDSVAAAHLQVAGSGTDDTITLTGDLGGQGVETVTVAAGAGDDVVDASGQSSAAVRLYLRGDAGSDTLTGGAGDDLLKGGDDGDTLDGGVGDDILIGGAGADTFVIANLGGTDTIVDFATADGDVLDLAALVVAADTLGSTLDDYLRISIDGDDTLLEIDTAGGGDFAVADATVRFAGIDLVTGHGDQAAIIDSLVGGGALGVDTVVV